MKNDILVAIPVLTGSDHCKAAIDSVFPKEGVQILIADNGAEESVKEMLKVYTAQPIYFERFHQNIFVNPVWNTFLKTFLSSSYERLVIMNSDLLMQSQWVEVVNNRWTINPDEILLPVMDELRDINPAVSNAQVVIEGTPGVFITLNRKQAEMVYPIPEDIKIWFGDLWIFTILRELGYQTVIPENLLAKHFWSSTVSRLPGISELIEHDKIQWADVVEPLMRQRIQFLKDKLYP